MSIQDFFVYGLIAICLVLCVVVMWQDGRIYDLERYIDRRMK